MVTAGTYSKAHRFRSRKRLRYLSGLLLKEANRYGWNLEAWAVFSNHYHWIGKSPLGEDGESLRTMTKEIHRQSAIWVNELDGIPRRKVWHNYWESALTFQKSYLARLRYVMENPVKHGLVSVANAYPWCSAGWFELRASPAFQKSLASMKIDRVNVLDDF